MQGARLDDDEAVDLPITFDFERGYSPRGDQESSGRGEVS